MLEIAPELTGHVLPLSKCEAYNDSTTGPATPTSNAIDPRRLAALCADLVGSDICTAPGIIARSYAPVLALCRRLIEAGIDPGRPLHVYRGDTLALVVRSIAEGARLTVGDNRLGHPRFVRFRPRSDGAALHMRQNGLSPAGAPCHEREQQGQGQAGTLREAPVLVVELTGMEQPVRQRAGALRRTRPAVQRQQQRPHPVLGAGGRPGTPRQ